MNAHIALGVLEDICSFCRQKREETEALSRCNTNAIDSKLILTLCSRSEEHEGIARYLDLPCLSKTLVVSLSQHC